VEQEFRAPTPMTQTSGTRLGLLAVSLCWLLASYAYSSRRDAPDPKPTPAQAEFFENKIRPVFAQNCASCHGKDSQNAGLRLDSLAAIKKGGNSGPAIISGDPDHSLLIKAVQQTSDLKMPPDGTKLAANQIADLQTWIKMGAPWPDDPMASQNKPLWSLLPVQKPTIPKVKLKVWAQNPIDKFVLAKLEANQLHPAPVADRRTLIRRVTYDLIGLPPTDQETADFLSDKSPNAYEKVVDRLLDSPHYGEREARHWMDVARYADTKGYVFNEDRNYPTAYTYRDWLINAFNQDLPYNKFIVDQLAADQLPEVQDKSDRSSLAAMGFLTLGRRFLNSQPDIIDDRIDVTMRGLQAFTVGCARCHDHKFDPIPTQDYYSLYAVFASSQEETIPIASAAASQPWEQYNQHKMELDNDIRTLVLAQIQRLRDQKPENLTPEIKQQLQALGVGALPDDNGVAKLSAAFEADAKTKLNGLQAELATTNKNAPPTPELALAMTDGPHPSDGVVFHHGNPNNRGAAAPRRFLLALSKPGEERVHWTKDSGRLELAEDIASTSDPLTARVYVNRVWQDHFGMGIVRTPSDFGHQGEPPTDPKLLDYLASYFMESGWSIKKLNRLIVTSATYCQSSSVSPATYNADPDNRDWDRMNRRRLDLEQLRDSLMMAAGKLDLKDLGGKSVDLWSEPYTPRRAVYGIVERQNLPAIFRTFDFASPDTTSARRFQTTVPQQALFFMNSPFAIQEAEAFASRPEIAKAKDNGQRVRRLYQILFDRLPDPFETNAALSYFKAQGDSGAPLPQVWQYGFGQYDPASQRVAAFTPMAHFDEGKYHPGDKVPDPQFGYAVLYPQGGHPGRDQAHAVIRRWVAPFTGKVAISGELAHPAAQGDGVRGRIVSNRSGLLGEWSIHHGKAATNVASIDVKKGETIDFVTDCVTNDGYDSFQWVPALRRLDVNQTWSADTGFGPPPPPPLATIALYAQALMMTNEFMFID
jgi:mono/diheme cytochrome c family protein